jgi:hypothetical protein
MWPNESEAFAIQMTVYNFGGGTPQNKKQHDWNLGARHGVPASTARRGKDVLSICCGAGRPGGQGRARQGKARQGRVSLMGPHDDHGPYRRRFWPGKRARRNRSVQKQRHAAAGGTDPAAQIHERVVSFINGDK